VFQRLKKQVETGALSALIIIPLVLCVVAFLGLACYFSLTSILPPSLAALVTAAAGIVLIAFVLLLARLSAPSSKKPPKAGVEDYADDFERLLGERADPLLARWAKEHPDRAAVTSLLLGLAAGYSRAARRVLLDAWLRHAEAETRRRGPRADD